MSHYNTSYKHLATREEKDAQAIKDIKEYATEKMWDLILVECGRAQERGTAGAFQSINFALNFVGIQGYPIHAVGRSYCLTAYRAWMHDGDKPVMTDDKGFPIEDDRAQ